MIYRNTTFDIVFWSQQLTKGRCRSRWCSARTGGGVHSWHEWEPRDSKGGRPLACGGENWNQFGRSIAWAGREGTAGYVVFFCLQNNLKNKVDGLEHWGMCDFCEQAPITCEMLSNVGKLDPNGVRLGPKSVHLPTFGDVPDTSRCSYKW